jgi:hypothetical protein
MSQRVNQSLLYPLPFPSGSVTITTTTTTTLPPTLTTNTVVPKNSGISDFTNLGTYITQNGDKAAFIQPSSNLQLSKTFNFYDKTDRSRLDGNFVSPSSLFVPIVPTIPTDQTLIKPAPLFNYQRSSIPQFTIDSTFNPVTMKVSLSEPAKVPLGGQQTSPASNKPPKDPNSPKSDSPRDLPPPPSKPVAWPPGTTSIDTGTGQATSSI